jgi:hypothetical protein
MYSQHQQRFLLAYIEKHIIEGNEHIATMRRLVAEGERQRFDMADAKDRLAEFLTAQAQRQAHREQVLRELDHQSG